MILQGNSLRRKVALVLFAAISASLLLAAAGLGLFAYRAAQDRFRSSLEALAQISFTQVIPAVDFNVAEAGAEALARLESSALVTSAIVLVPRPGAPPERFARFDRPGRAPHFDGVARRDGFYREGNRALLVTTFVRDGAPVATLQLEGDFSATRRELTTSLQLVGGVFVFLLAVGWVLSGWLESAITRPVLKLSDTVRRVHETGDYGLRAKPETHDEIGQLAVQFNAMLAGIAERDHQLAESGAFQKAILDHAGLSVISTGPDGVIRTFNHAAELMLGYPAAEMIGRRTPEIVHDRLELGLRAEGLALDYGLNVRPGFEVLVTRARRGEVESREWTYVRRDGTRLPVLLAVSALRRQDGSILGFCALATDLTGRKRAEDTLRASEERFRVLVENAPDAIVVLDPAAGKFTAVNREAERLFELPRERLIGCSPIDLSPERQPDGRPSADAAQEYIAAGLAGHNPSFEWIHRAASGRNIACEVRLMRLPDPHRVLLRGSIINVSEHKRTEAALKALTTGTAGVTGQGFFNATVERLAGELDVRCALIGQLFEEGGRTRVRTLAAWSGGLQENFTFDLADTPTETVTRTGAVHFGRDVAELFPQDGRLAQMKAVSYFGMVINDAAGRPRGVVSVIDDKPMADSRAARFLVAVSAARAGAELDRLDAEAAVHELNTALEHRVRDRTAELAARVADVERLNQEQQVLMRDLGSSQQAADRAAARLQEANSSLLVANQELEAFSYSVSHDLRAPLRNITGFVELLGKRTGDRLDSESQRFLSTVIAEARRMGMLIDDLLTFARIGRSEMKLQAVCLDELLTEVRQELQSEIGERAIEWKIGTLPLVQGDRALLHQVVANLLGNAVKFTRRRPAALIEISAGPTRPDDRHVTIAVRDNGAGFNPKYLDKLFGVFQRLHNSRDFEGTGIGLANVKRIITRHGGRVWAEGDVDKGATFYFTLRPAATG